MIRQVDSSLLDEWEKMRDPTYQRAAAKELRPPGAEEADQDVTRDAKAFTAAIRHRIFSFLRGLADQDFEQALTHLSSPQDPDGPPWTAERLAQALAPFYAEHERICLHPDARNVRHTYVLPAEDKRTWRIQQILVDLAEHNDWLAEFEVDLIQSKASGEPFLRLLRIGKL
jgi:hypothetical protein